MNDLSSQSLLHYAQQVAHQRLDWPVLAKKGLTVYLRRDDLASDRYPGNKFYKLFYNLQAIIEYGHRAVLSFGGAYSNHIHALAQMGEAYGLATIGIIRGHQPDQLSPTLEDAKACGMQLLFLDKQAYKNKDLTPLQSVLDAYGDYYVLPEGAENRLAIQGCKAIGQAIDDSFSGDYTVCTAVGTGTTFAGIILGLPVQQPCLGFSVLKGEDRLSATIEAWLTQECADNDQWRLITGYHHGGYAKTTPELLAFMLDLERRNQLLLEPVYSAKMLWGIEQMALEGYWRKGASIIVVHGGGLQGRRGFRLTNQ